MSKKLVIVESPAKAGTIKKILGPDYEVTASVGHIRDLPKSKLGVDVDNQFKPSYTTIKGKGEIIKKLKELAKKSDKIFLASDPDREGEAIAWHLSEILKLDNSAVRVEFNEITKNAIKAAMKKPRNIDMNKVDAQQARRILDRLVGYKISPLLWKVIDVNTSAGRVQSVALKLICDLEDIIKNFISEKYWDVSGVFGKNIELKLNKIADEKVDKIKDEAIVNELETKIKGETFTVKGIKVTKKSKRPPLPFKTSTLQQLASSSLGFSATRTMKIAQSLYEGIEIKGNHMGLITYMRTDSHRISDEAKSSAQNYIKAIYGEKYVGDYIPPATKGKVQDAHEAIRPTEVNNIPDIIKENLTVDQYKLYKLIWERFLISQFSNLEYEQMEIITEFDKYEFRGIQNKMIFDGYYRVMKDDEEDVMLSDFPILNEKELIKLTKLNIKEGVTKPPARYSESALVKKLEAEGIGRPSTYAAIIETLKARDYVKVESRIFHPTELGYSVKEHLEKYFPNIMNIKFTAEMESNLDLVEEGSKKWVDIMEVFYNDLKKYLKPLEDEVEEFNSKTIYTNTECSKCGKRMVLKIGRFGKYIECEDAECKEKISLPKGIIIPREEIEAGEVNVKNILDEINREKTGIKTDAKCEKDGGELVIKTGRFGKYLECEHYSECKNRFGIPKEIKLTPEELKNDIVNIADRLTLILEAEKKVLEEFGTCDKCGKPMSVKSGRFGKFLACTGYPECKNIKKYPRAASDKKKTENSEEKSVKKSAKTKKSNS